MYTFGFIGVGNMGSALARAAAKTLGGAEIIVSNRTAEKAKVLATELGCHYGDNAAVASEAKYIFLGVKPQMMTGVLNDIAPVLNARDDDFTLVTMAAGVEIARIRDILAANYPVIRIMPNTPCAIGQGVILSAKGADVTDEEYSRFKLLLGAAGELIDVPEKLIDAGSAVSGCGPAFVYMFIEAMADAGVSLGLTRADAKKLSAAMVKGAAGMVLETSEHPAKLKDDVCSPGGSTIQGVMSLERGGFRAAVEDAVVAAYRKTLELGK